MDYEKADELAINWWLIADVSKSGGFTPQEGLEALREFTPEDFQAISSNPELFIYALQHCMDVDDNTREQIRRNAPKARGGARGAVARSAPAPAKANKKPSNEVERVAQLADEAGIPTNESYRKLQEWGRTFDLRKGSDFWRAVVTHRRTHPHSAPGAPGALRTLRAV